MAIGKEISYDNFRKFLEELQYKKSLLEKTDAERKGLHAKYREIFKNYNDKVIQVEKLREELIKMIPPRV